VDDTMFSKEVYFHFNRYVKDTTPCTRSRIILMSQLTLITKLTHE